MIQIGSFLNIVDNSGAKTALCIKIVSGSKKRYAFTGDTLLVSIKSIRSKRRSFSKVKKGEIYKALLIRTKNTTTNRFKNSFNFFQNAVILISKQNKLIGTRIFGSLPNFLRFTKYMRIISLSSGVIK